MKRILLRSSFLILAVSTTALAQTPTATPVPQKDDEVVKITTQLVQVDAVVTDKKGNPVTGLKDSDFQIFQDGKLQRITGLTYVSTKEHTVERILDVKKGKNDIPAPPVPFRASELGRLVTFIVDDGNCSVSTLGIEAVREGLKKFVNEQMLPNDRVAIYRTRAGSSTLQQYTSDKAFLLRSITQIRWYPPVGNCDPGDGSFFPAAKSNTVINMTPGGTTESQIESDADRKTRERGEDFNRNNTVTGAIGVINYVISGLERVGGRKVVFFMSDGLSIRSRGGDVLSAANALQVVAEHANRASVVFNTIDVRGVFSTIGIEAADEVSTRSDVNASDKVIADRDRAVTLSQDGLFYLADATGGRFYRNSNKLDIPVRRALDSEQGYYLLAYEPAEDTFRGKRYNNIEIKVNRPNLIVKSRAGFYGTVDQPLQEKRSSGNELYDAIAAPIPQAGMDLRLTAYFGNTPSEGNYVRSLIHLQGDDITFVDDTPGFKKAVFDVVAVTMDERNKVVDEFSRTHTFKVEAAATEIIKKNGLIYSTDVPITKPGIYNFRVAIRDVRSKMIGSSSQVVEIPDLKKGKLFLSGLTMCQIDSTGKFMIPGQVKPENALAMTGMTGVPAIRQFQPPAALAYSYVIYNAQLDQTTQMPKISAQMKLFKDGVLIADGKLLPVTFQKQADWSRILDYSKLGIDTAVAPGDYTLQLIIKDELAAKDGVASQWVDFEVLPPRK